MLTMYSVYRTVFTVCRKRWDRRGKEAHRKFIMPLLNRNATVCSGQRIIYIYLKKRYQFDRSICHWYLRFSGSKERKETVPYFNGHRQRFVRSSNSCSVVWLLGWDFRNLGCLYSAKSRKFHGRIGPEFIAWRASLHTTSDRDSSSLRNFWETIGYQHPRPLSLSRYRLVSNVLPFKLSSSFGQYQPT